MRIIKLGETSDANDRKLNEMNGLIRNMDALVRYHSPGCPHCLAMNKDWNMMETKLRKEPKYNRANILVVSVEPNYFDKLDCFNQPEGVPLIAALSKGKKVAQHEGPRTADALLEFFENELMSRQSHYGGGRRTKHKLKRGGKKRQTRKKLGGRRGRKKHVRTRLGSLIKNYKKDRRRGFIHRKNPY